MSGTFAISCPLPLSHHKTIVMGHGTGGRLTAQLIHDLFLPAFDNPLLRKMDDQAVLDVGNARLAFTTDSFVVTPLFFPGGDIGELAVNGTVNDLAMCGARPLYLSAAFILEEGLALEELSRVVASMAAAAAAAGVAIVTGDTKVVESPFGGQTFHYHHGHWSGSGRRPHLRIECQAGRCGDRERLFGRSRNGGHVEAGGHGTGRRDSIRHAAAALPCSRDAACRSCRYPRFARPDPRRPCRVIVRDLRLFGYRCRDRRQKGAGSRGSQRRLRTLGNRSLVRGQ